MIKQFGDTPEVYLNSLSLNQFCYLYLRLLRKQKDHPKLKIIRKRKRTLAALFEYKPITILKEVYSNASLQRHLPKSELEEK